MSRLVSGVSLEQIDEWFKIGKTAVKVKTVPRTTTGGRALEAVDEDSKTRAGSQPAYVSVFKRDDGYGQDIDSFYHQDTQAHLSNLEQLPGWEPPENDVDSVAGNLEQLDMGSLVSGSVSTMIPDDLVPENATDIYKNYEFRQKYDTKLPILRHHEEIITTVESNQVTIIQGSTGSGKTTQVPQYILDYYAKEGKYCNIIVTQPRRIAAMSICKRVCHERGWQQGTICGYQVGMDKVASDDTRLMYVTTGVLLQILINKKNMSAYTHVILDEVHDRDEDTDFCLLVVRKFLNTVSRHVKVILMSATIDTDVFANYFGVQVLGKLEPAPVVSVEGRTYDVGEYFVENFASLLNPPAIPPLEEENPMISEEAEDLCVRLIKEIDTIEAKEQGVGQTGFAEARGSVLIFLPGLAEIESLRKKLDSIYQHQLIVIPLHSSITMEDQAKAFESVATGYRKVILSTNIAESSITVPDIKYVIDFCLTKNLVCDRETHYTALHVNWASKANSSQRKGRAGRVSMGRCYRMVTKQFYENCIPDFGIPEMERCPLEQLILRVKVLDLGEPKAILGLALSRPQPLYIETAVLVLKEIGALATPTTAVQNKYDGDLTFIGRILAALPVDIRVGKLLVMGHVFGLLEECLIIGAGLSLKSMFSRPYKKQLEAYRKRLEWADNSLSDCFAVLKAYRVWSNNKMTGVFRRGRSEADWCSKNFLQIRRMREVDELVKDLEKRLYTFNIQCPKRRPGFKRDISDSTESLLLKVVLCGAFYPYYFLRSDIDEQASNRELSGENPLNTVMVKGIPPNQGLLYHENIVDMFRCCSLGVTPDIHFEETKAYIIFKKKSSRPDTDNENPVHPSVYLALKLRFLSQKSPLELQLYSQDETRVMMQKLEEAQRVAKEVKNLQTHRVTSFASDSRRVKLPGPEFTYVYLIVTDVRECGHFWAQFTENENYKALCDVQQELNNQGGYNLQPITDVIRNGMYVAAPYTDGGMTQFYRACVEQIDRLYDNNTKTWREIAEIFFVDYGNSEKKDRNELRQLPPKLLDIPFQAVECFLFKFRPSPVKCPDGKWTRAATEKFRQLVDGKKLIAQIYSVVDGALRIDLNDVRRNGQQYSINDELIDEYHFADRAEENYISKRNHELRESGRASSEMLSSGQKNSWLQVEMNSGPAYGGRRGYKKILNGPTNPNEMDFFGMTNISRLRAVRVEPDSVNSVAIEPEPHQPCHRLMCASTVSLNSAGNAMIARDTTIMPLIPGLPALIALIFTPAAELRTNRRKTMYTGAICGLGYDPYTNQPVLPDHDMEITFDAKIDLTDLLKINGIRIAIQLAVGSQDTVSRWSMDPVLTLQENARKKLLNLIQTRREPITEAHHYDRPYRWNQVDPDDVLHHQVDESVESFSSSLNLHAGIHLKEEEESEVSYGESAVGDESLQPLRHHIKQLHKISKERNRKGPFHCNLCGINSFTTHALDLHLNTQTHLTNEERLFSL